MLDTLALVETPEGVALRLRTAGVIPRSAAWAVDFVVRCFLMFALGTVFALLGQGGQGLYLIALFVTFWGYNVLFELLHDGQTIGKRAFGLRVVNANGTPVTWLASIVRNLMRTVDMLPFGYATGIVAGLFDANSRRLGDMVAGTLVVHVKPALAPHDAVASEPVPLPFPLPLADKAAIVAFAERAPFITPERSRELADIVPMLTQAHGESAVSRLLGMANTILGRRASR